MPNIKFPISALPLPPKSHTLIHNLTADPGTPLPQSFRKVLESIPSIQRRARVVDSSAHYSHVTPLNLEFPYRIEVPQDTARDQLEKAAYIESWLSDREPLEERPCAPTKKAIADKQLKKYSRDLRERGRELLALSCSCLQDCVPHLDAGDAFAQLGKPALSTVEEEIASSSEEERAIGQELVDVLTGHSVLMAVEDHAKLPYAPWSCRYSGHQFGVWAGQLGDGRAISILETPHPNDPDTIHELQLKGAGRTPYSRHADGLAVCRSSIREYLCSEAMNALGIPTTRALALIYLPDLTVVREKTELACVLTRVAPSFIRIGSFEALNPPHGTFFIGGGQQDANFEALRILGEWTCKRVLKLPFLEGTEDAPWARELVRECAHRNAKMAAGWQAYGFMHGVINTDNVSIMGLTIDYGPYAFMDIYDPMHICNHSDGEGRYAFKYQPAMVIYAIRALINALAPILGAEAELGSAVKPGWANGVSDSKIKEWSTIGCEIGAEVKEEVEKLIENEQWELYRKRLGLRTSDPADVVDLIKPLLNLMENYKLDFHMTLRTLCSFKPYTASEDSSGAINTLLKELAGNSFNRPADNERFTKDWKFWLKGYAGRIEKERSLWEFTSTDGPDLWVERKKAMRSANPRFVLRQWVLEEIIKRVQDDPASGKRALAKVHEMAIRPFESWGAEDGVELTELSSEDREERRFCGLGPMQFSGFQCSCSS